MTLVSLLVFLLPILMGVLFVHMFWPEKGNTFLLFKLALGLGLGLGVNSMIYFLTLLVMPTFQNTWVIPAGFITVLIIATIFQERKKNWMAIKFSQITRLQWILLGITAIALIFSGLIFFNLTKARPQGSYDAWGIWNRAARFIYRDPENWKATLSPDLYWGTHPDYPLLIPLNVAWGWSIIGKETLRTPMMQSALFTIANLLLVFSSIRLTRTLGQACLAVLVLVSTPIFLSSSYGQIADSPLAFFILATCALMYLYFKFNQPKLLILAGFMAGMGAWTKNEGLLFVVVSFPALFLATGRKEFLRPLRLYLLGLAIPIAIVLYFKIMLTPPGDLFTTSAGNDSMLQKLETYPRYWIIAKAVITTMLTYSGWPFSIFIQLTVYALFMRMDTAKTSKKGIRAVTSIILLQLLGYCAIYVVTPYDLSWHLKSSLPRLILHLFPTFVFLFFCLVVDPEKVFQNIRKGTAQID